MTGLPVRNANPAGDARSAPTVATPTTPGLPTHAGANEQVALGWNILENLAELGTQAFARQARGFVEKLGERGTFAGP